MAIKMERGGYCVGPGGPVELGGVEAQFADALFRLQCVRGSFPFLPDLGSRLWRLGLERPADRPALARQFCAEALEGCSVDVTEVRVRQEGYALVVEAELQRGENSTSVEVSI